MKKLVAAVAGVVAAAGFAVAPIGSQGATVSALVVLDPSGSTAPFSADLVPSHSQSPPSSSTSETEPVVFAGIQAGRYQVRLSSLAPDVDLASLTCEPAAAVTSVDVAEGVAVLDVSSGQQVACTAQGERRGAIDVRTQMQPRTTKVPVEVTPSWSQTVRQHMNQTLSSPSLVPGTYSVTAQAPPGWDITSATCDDGSDPAAIDLGPAEDVTCTVEATKRGSVSLEVVTQPERQRRFAVDTSWGERRRLSSATEPETTDLPPGTYSVEADMPDGWDASLRCADGSQAAAIELDPGERLACTLTATKRGTVTVLTTTDPVDRTIEVEPSWGKPFELDDEQSQQSRPLRPGPKSVDVTAPRGWAVASATCSDGSKPDDIDLDPGEDVTCEFKIVKRGTITVVAATNPSGSDAVLGYSPSWGEPFTLTDEQTFTSRRLRPGTYSVDATPPEGWSTGIAECDDGSDPAAIELDPGEDVVCTFTHALPRFTVASFNILGDSHSDAGGYAARFASGPTRMGWTIDLIRARGVDVIGMQEVQPGQASAFLQRTGDFAMYPGPGAPLSFRQNVVAWRTSVFELVDAQPNLTPYLNGNRVSMPVVKLRHRDSGMQVYVISAHNAASIARTGNNDRWRAAAMRQQVELTNRLLATGTPVIMTGDMNSRTEYFCTYTRSGRMKAAAGGSSGGRCQPPPATLARIDWIFGSDDITFSGYASLRQSVVGRISDHPFLVAEALLRS